MKKLSHINDEGRVRMVDVTTKNDTTRIARACGLVTMNRSTLDLIAKGEIAKGNVLGIAKVAGIMAAKKTGTLIPLCHPLELTDIDLDLKINQLKSQVTISATVKTIGKTGVEMEAMTAVSVAALTVYDMCKAADKNMIIGDIMLLSKTGGKSGPFSRNK